jgi:hypothetical protein
LANLEAFTSGTTNIDDEKFIEYRVDLKNQHLKFYWKDDENQTLDQLERKLVFHLQQ